MRAAVIGAVGSTAVLLEKLEDATDWEVPLVVTLPRELYARHSDIVDLSPHCERAGARLYCTGKTNDSETLAAIDGAQPDYIFVVGWSQLCSPEFLALRKDKVIGYHPAALPRLRGRAALPWTILLDERITAGSLFWMNKGTDDGDLLAQRFFHLAGDEKVGELYERHMQCLGNMLDDVLPRLAKGREDRMPQNDRYATWAAKRTPADGLIDWTQGARNIDRLIRAVGEPYPGAFCFSGSRKLSVWESNLDCGTSRYHAMPGQIVSRQDGTLVVQTGEGLIALTKWEIEGDKAPLLHVKLKGSNDRV